MLQNFSCLLGSEFRGKTRVLKIATSLIKDESS